MAKPSANSVQKLQNSSPNTGVTRYFRLKRKGNGWVLECLELMGGRVHVFEKGDWDYLSVCEAKLLNDAVGDAKRAI